MKSTSWGHVAGWYSNYLDGDDTYQSAVIAPNLVRALNLTQGEKVLDVACGTGYFSALYKKAGADVIGVDIGAELIEIAKKDNPDISFHISSSENLSFVSDATMSKCACVLAIQNIEKVKETFQEVKRVLKPGGRFFIVLNHPAFRIPHGSSWGYDAMANIQYRRIDQYISEKRITIDMNPAKKGTSTTVTFHRPLQYYSKLLANTGFAIARLEEWTSHKESDPGPRKIAEDRSRKEIPMFLLLEAISF